MSTRAISFFALPAEFFSWISDAHDAIPLDFVLESATPVPGFRRADLVEVMHLAAVCKQPFWRFYAAKPEGSWPVKDAELNPNRWGLVTCEPPRIVDDETLLLATVSSKSDLYGVELEQGRDAHRLYSKIRKVMVKNLSRPVWLRNLQFPEQGASAFRDLWYSEGASKWVEAGGLLRQQGIANSEFLLKDPSS